MSDKQKLIERIDALAQETEPGDDVLLELYNDIKEYLKKYSDVGFLPFDELWCKYNLWENQVLAEVYRNLFHFFYNRLSIKEDESFFPKAKYILEHEDLLSDTLDELENKKVEFASKDTLRLTNLYVYNFAEIKELNLYLPDCPDFIVLTGENAKGKTLILQAIAVSQLFDFQGKGIAIVGYCKKDKFYRNIRVYKKRTGPFTIPFPLIAYGASRLLLQNSQADIEQEKLVESDVYSIFHSGATLLNVENWLRRLKLRNQDKKIEEVCRALAKLSPSIEEVRLEEDKVFLILTFFVVASFSA